MDSKSEFRGVGYPTLVARSDPSFDVRVPISILSRLPCTQVSSRLVYIPIPLYQQLLWLRRHLASIIHTSHLFSNSKPHARYLSSLTNSAPPHSNLSSSSFALLILSRCFENFTQFDTRTFSLLFFGSDRGFRCLVRSQR